MMLLPTPNTPFKPTRGSQQVGSTDVLQLLEVPQVELEEHAGQEEQPWLEDGGTKAAFPP
jgi:hypothetical protein